MQDAPAALKGVDLTPVILRVAVPSPLHQTFDYLPPQGSELRTLRPGIRVLVPFGRRWTVGLLMGLQRGTAIARERLKAAQRILDIEPVLSDEMLGLLQWTAQYYHHAIGDVITTALPALLRRGQAARMQGIRRWHLTSLGHSADPQTLRRAPRQATLLRRLSASPEGITEDQIESRSALRALHDRGWVASEDAPRPADVPQADDPGSVPTLNTAQQAAVTLVGERLGAFGAFVIDGVTGSGKTEVYLRIIERVIATGRQALVLVPEIGLTPQLVERFHRRLRVPLAVLHSGLSERERLCGWLMARDGTAPVVVGTRSAVFTPLARPGVLVVDEEHDLSFKQQEGLRYCARDLAVVRARHAGVPVLLGSATPSLESLHNVRCGRYAALRLPERAGAATHPQLQVLDVRSRPLTDGLSEPLARLIGEHLEAGSQVLLFLNRRGYAPTLLCHDCGWVARCRRCDAHVVVHQRDRLLRCHHCGAGHALPGQCPECGSGELRALGEGTQRIEQALHRRHPGVELLRIDRDSTRRKGELQQLLRRARAGRSGILIGTQMLAKGHHFPDVTLVGLIDADHGLFSTDFRAAERMAQLIIQVAGRAGRADKAGLVVLQSHHPDHPLLQLLLREGYGAFAAAALKERSQVGLPPYSHLALLRAEALDPATSEQFLTDAQRVAHDLATAEVQVLGPVPAPMERRAGRYRSQLLLQCRRRAALHALLRALVPRVAELPLARRVRWSLDVDPQELT